MSSKLKICAFFCGICFTILNFFTDRYTIEREGERNVGSCTIKIVCENTYIARMTEIIVSRLGFDAAISERPDGDINIVDDNAYLGGEPDPDRTICLTEPGGAIPKGARTVVMKPYRISELERVVGEMYDRLYSESDLHPLIQGDRLMYKGKSVEFTEREAMLYRYLYERADTPVSRDELRAAVWEGEASESANVTDVYINYIRKKLRDAFGIDVIRSIRGVGYMYTSEYATVGKH